jgi:hypothetical protein
VFAGGTLRVAENPCNFRQMGWSLAPAVAILATPYKTGRRPFFKSIFFKTTDRGFAKNEQS